MHRKFSRLLSVILLMGLLLASAGNVTAQTTEPVSKESATEKGILPVAAPNLIQDPSLEQSYGSNQYWTGQFSSNADSPLCAKSNVDCLFGTGAAGPHTGTKWAMYGGIDWEDPESINPELGYIFQDVTFPACGASLQFYFWIGRAPAGSDANDLFDVWIDTTKIFSKSALDAASYPAYTLVTLDVSAFADGAAHRVKFRSITSDQSVIFNLDDISLTCTYVTLSGNAGIAGATVDYTGGSTTADGSGNYSFDVAYDWSGTVTPSKTGYTFSPASRTYTNLATHQTSQNYTATGPMISGNVGVAGVTLSYTDGTSKTATSGPNGEYAFTVSGDWSGTVTPSHPCYTFTPTDRSYTSVITNQPGQDYEPTPIPAAGCAEIKVDIAGTNRGIFPISSQSTLTEKAFPSLNNGPVKIHSTVPILGSDRVIYKVGGVPVSFSEMIGLPASQLDHIYFLPWYTNNQDLNTQLRIANVSGTDGSVQIIIGGKSMGSFSVPMGTTVFKTFADIDKGAVKIRSNVNLVVSERVTFKVNNRVTSLSEMMALPASQLDKTYWLPWYTNSQGRNMQLQIGNVSSGPASVRIWIGGTEMTGSPLVIPVGRSIRQAFPGIHDGPVRIKSNVNIVASESFVYTVNKVPTSFSEMMALPAKQLDTIYWLPRYNNISMGSQLRITNVDATNTTVHVFMGGTEVTSPFIVPAGKTVLKTFTGINKGLVKIESENGIRIVVSERVIFKAQGITTSFSELMGLPAAQLSETFWLPWYNNQKMSTLLRFGVP